MENKHPQSSNTYNCDELKKTVKVKYEYKEDENNENYKNFKNAKLGEKDHEKSHKPYMTYTCPFKHEDYGNRCKAKSATLTESLNHFYHHHMERVDLEGRQPRFPLCCFLSNCTEQFIFHQDLVRHMAKHDKGENIYFVQCLLNRKDTKEAAEDSIRDKMEKDYESKIGKIKHCFLKKERELLEERHYFEEKYEKEILHLNALIKQSEVVSKDQIQQIAELQRKNSDHSERQILDEQKREKLINRIKEMEGQLVSLKEQSQEKEEALKNEIKCLEQRSKDEKEVKNETFIGNKLTIDNIKRQYEYENLDEKKDLDEKKPTFEDKLICSKPNAKSKQRDDLSKKEIKNPESKNIEDFHYEETSLIPGKHTVDFNTANLHDIIIHLKDENDHLRLKSKLQKETRDKLEKKICLLKKQVKESGKTQTKNICDEEEKYVQIKRLKYQEQTIRKQESEFTNKKNDFSQYDSRNGDQKKSWQKRKRLCTSKFSINDKHLKYHH